MRIRSRVWFERAVTFLVLLVVLTAPVQAQGIQRERKAAKAQLVSRLEGVVKLCKLNKLQAERKRVSDLILRFDDRNHQALLGAGYRKARGGEWKPPRASKSFVDAEDAPEELQKARDEVRAAMGEFVKRLEQLLDTEGLSGAELDLVSGDILAVDPRNKRLRRKRGEEGEVYFGGQWILDETMSGLDGRALLREMREDAEKQSAYEAEVFDVDTFGISWKLAEPTGVQVFVTGEEEEARRLARLVGTVELVFGWFFQAHPSYPVRCRFFLMSEAEKDTFLDNHPNIGAANKARFANLELSGIPGSSDQAFFADTPDQRADALARMCWLWFFQSTFGIDMTKGWVTDGFGIYLTEVLLDTRLTWFSTPLSEGTVQWGELLDQETAWMVEAAQLFADESDLVLTPTLNKRQDQFSARDLLLSYAFVGYLCEVRHDILPAALRRIGLNKPAGPTFQLTGELVLRHLPARMQRWLGERQRMPDVIFERKSRNSMRTELAKLPDRKRGELARAFTELLSENDTELVHILRRYELTPVDGPFSDELPFYDPEVYAPGLPIPRTELARDDIRVVSLRKRVGKDGYQPLVDYDFAEREIRGASSDGLDADYDRTVGALLEGRSPYFDLVRAAILKELDDGTMREEFEAFGHAYTDREGNVYSGVSLYDVWSSGMLMEMPDVDVLGILTNLVGDVRVRSPIPSSTHDRLYKRIGKLFADLRPYRPMREAIADTLLLGKPLSADYKSYEVPLNALWIEVDFDTRRVARMLAEEPPQVVLDGWVQRCKEDRDLWLQAKRRAIEVKRDLLMLRSDLVDALEVVGVLDFSE